MSIQKQLHFTPSDRSSPISHIGIPISEKHIYGIPSRYTWGREKEVGNPKSGIEFWWENRVMTGGADANTDVSAQQIYRLQ